MSELTLRSTLFRDGETIPADSLLRLLASPVGVRVTTALVAQPSVLNTLKRIGQSALTGLLDIRLADVLGAAWNKYRVLRDYAGKQDGKARYVELVEHSLDATYNPVLRVVVSGQTLTEFKGLVLKVQLGIKGLCLKVESGRIVTIESGTGSGKVSLKAEDQEIFERPMFDVRLPGALRLGDGIPIAA